MKHLYDNNGRYTSRATTLSQEAYSALHAIFARVVKEGYSFREASQIMQATVVDLELSAALNLNFGAEEEAKEPREETQACNHGFCENCPGFDGEVCEHCGYEDCRCSEYWSEY